MTIVEACLAYTYFAHAITILIYYSVFWLEFAFMFYNFGFILKSQMWALGQVVHVNFGVLIRTF